MNRLFEIQTIKTRIGDKHNPKGDAVKNIYAYKEMDCICCPICYSIFKCSSLSDSKYAKQSDKSKWIVNMIIHYRHEHTKWDTQWKSYSEVRYISEKRSIKEITIRQIIRKCTNYLVENNIYSSDFNFLQLEEKTMILARNMLDNIKMAA